MSDLAAFLLARIAEDETSTQPWQERPYDGELELHRNTCLMFGAVERSDAECDCNGPTRWQAECEAKRRIVEQWRGNVTVMAAGDGDLWNLGQSDALDLVLALLALPYADHPDYEALLAAQKVKR